MVVTINGVSAPPGTLTEYSAEVNDLYGENTGRDETGQTHLDLVRRGVRKVQLGFSQLTAAQVASLTGALNPLGFTFTGPVNGVQASFKAYAGPPSIKMTSNASAERYSLSFSVIEI